MRKLKLLALLTLLALPALARGAINLALGTRFEFTDCAAGGSAAQTLALGQYLFRVTDEAVFVCFAAAGSTCAAGGEKFPGGMAMLLNVTGDKVSVSCRSAGATGDAIFTKAY